MNTVEHVGGATVVKITEEKLFDDALITALREELIAALGNEKGPKLAIDFSAVAAASSRFFGVLVAVHKRARAAKGKVVLFALNPTLARLIAVTKMDKLFQIEATEEEALKALLKGSRWLG